MNKDEVAQILEQISRLLELKGENPFKIRAYVNAARALDTLGGDLEKMIEEDRLREVEGIGKAIAEKITTLIRTGRLEYYEKLRDEFPPEIFVLFELQGLGARKIKALYETLGISSITRLERACREGKIAALPGFGAKTSENLLKAIEQRTKSLGQFRLGDVMALVEELLERSSQPSPRESRADCGKLQAKKGDCSRSGLHCLHPESGGGVRRLCQASSC